MSPNKTVRSELVAGGMLLALNSYGEKTDEIPLLILPGWLSPASIWRELAETLAGNRQVVVMDWPGFGGAPIPKDTLRMEDYARATEEIIRRLGGKAHLLGHSFGGRVAIRTANIYPSAVSKIVLLDSAGFEDKSFRANFLRVLASTIKKIFNGTFIMSFARMMGLALGARDALTAGPMRKTFEAVIYEDLSKDMCALNQETLILWGRNDTVTPPEFAERMHKLIPNSKLEWIENAGHASFLDQPARVISSVSSFLS